MQRHWLLFTVVNRMKEKDNKTTLDAMHSIGLFLPINEIKVSNTDVSRTCPIDVNR